MTRRLARLGVIGMPVSIDNCARKRRVARSSRGGGAAGSSTRKSLSRRSGAPAASIFFGQGIRPQDGVAAIDDEAPKRNRAARQKRFMILKEWRRIRRGGSGPGRKRTRR